MMIKDENLLDGVFILLLNDYLKKFISLATFPQKTYTY